MMNLHFTISQNSLLNLNRVGIESLWVVLMRITRPRLKNNNVDNKHAGHLALFNDNALNTSAFQHVACKIPLFFFRSARQY